MPLSNPSINMTNPSTLAIAVTCTKLFTVTSMAFLLYEHVITSGTEVEFVWNCRWSSGKVLFIVNRYFGLFTLIFNTMVFFNDSLTNEFCSGFLWWETTAAMITILNAEVILQIRLFAVYQCSGKLRVIMAGLCFLQILIAMLVISLGMPPGIARPARGVTGCYAGSAVGDTYFTTWLPPLLFETFLCFLMLYKWYRTYQDDDESPLLSIIIRDSMLYYVTIFSVLLLNALVYSLAPQGILGELGSSWLVAVPCAVSSRLLLNMREQCFKAETMLPLSLIAGDERN